MSNTRIAQDNRWEEQGPDDSNADWLLRAPYCQGVVVVLPGRSRFHRYCGDVRNFDVALDFSGDFYDDPTFQLTKFVSHDLSPMNFAGSTDRFLDALYVGQAMTTDTRQRAKMVRDLERHALNEAYTVPLLWWNRIVAHSSRLKGWNITPSHFIGQDLADVWIAGDTATLSAHDHVSR